MNIPLMNNLILPRFKPLLSERGWAGARKSLAAATINGLIHGLALLILLPTTVTLATGGTAWGLGLGGWLILLAVLAAIGAGTEYFLAMVAYCTAMDFVQSVHQRLGDHIAKIPLGWFTAKSAGWFSRMVSKEMMSLGEILAHMVYPLIQHSTTLVVIVVGSWVWDWRLGLALTISVPVLYVILTLSRLALNRGKRISEPTENELAARVVEYAMCQGALRSCGQSEHYQQLDQAIQADYRAHRRSLWWGLLANGLPGGLSQAIVVGLVIISGSLALSGALGPIEAIAFMGLSLRFYQNLSEVQEGIMGIEDRRQLMNQMDRVVQAPLLSQPEISTEQSQPGCVELVDVHFGYKPDKPVINGVSFTVPARTMTAIVGPSGCGKTTIARLAARFYDVGSGSVKVGGTDVRRLRIEDLMSQVSWVFQDVYLFDDTLENNIRVGREQATDEEIRDAARLAGVAEIVSRLPQGYQTQVGEGGRALSGGERQRVSVARALLKQAPIVLFDEATSALDAENEANVVASLQELRRHSTLLVIAHKLETIMAADQVIVLNDNGRVEQRGTHAELIEQPGLYQGFWVRREQAAGWRLQ